jgi:hypothetical protein
VPQPPSAAPTARIPFARTAVVAELSSGEVTRQLGVNA